MKVEVISTPVLKDYVRGVFSKHSDTNIELTGWINATQMPDIQEYAEETGYERNALAEEAASADAVLLAIPLNNTLSMQIEYLHDLGIKKDIYIVRLSTIDERRDFLDENGFADRYVDRIGPDEPYLVHLETHVCDYCNLNCKACNNFSPFVKDRKCDSADAYERDLKKLSEMHITIGRLFLLGGEPMLEPELCCRFMNIARKYYPHSEIRLMTNGILTSKMQTDFWKCVRGNDVIVHVSLYPPTEKVLPEIREAFEKNGIRNFIGEKVETFEKRWTLYPFENQQFNTLKCGSSGCHYLRDGYISKCPDAILIENMDNVLHTELKSQNGLLKIDDVRDPWSFIETLNKPIDLCKYCSVERLEHVKWERTGISPKLEDWVIDNKFEYGQKNFQVEIQTFKDTLTEYAKKYDRNFDEYRDITNTFQQRFSKMNVDVEEVKQKFRTEEKQTENLEKQVKDLERYYDELKENNSELINIINAKNEQIEKDIISMNNLYNIDKDIRKSFSFRIGRIITFLPRMFRSIF